MANSLGSNPIYIDTDTGGVDVGLTVFGNSKTIFYIQNIEWQNPSAGDTVILTDAAGVPIFSQTCPTGGGGFCRDFHGAGVKGLKIANGALVGGELSILLA
jgi:hypothetical protein